MKEGEDNDERLPRRDWLLLPLVIILTSMVLAGASELVAGLMFPERGKFTCSGKDHSGLMRQKPNCVTTLKNAEGPMVEYRFNECGYRTPDHCGPKPPNTLRIVLMGTSITMGLYVPFDETFAARVERELSRICGKHVEVQNMGAMVSVSAQPELVGEALALAPDVIVLTVVPFDIAELGGPRPIVAADGVDGGIRSVLNKLNTNLHGTKIALAAVHFMLQDEQSMYHYHLSTGASRDIMSSPLTPSGARSYGAFAAVVDRMVRRLEGSGVPLVIMAVPNRVAAGLVSNKTSVDGVDAWEFGRLVGESAIEHHALAVDATPEFARTPHAERFFYPVDNHPKGQAHEAMARALVARLTDGSIPQLRPCLLLGSESR